MNNNSVLNIIAIISICDYNVSGSTDMGNVSQSVPTISPAIDIGTSASLHSEAFTTASGGEAALGERTLSI